MSAYAGGVITLDTGATSHSFPIFLLQQIAKDLKGTIEDGFLMVPCSYRERLGNVKYQFGKKEIVTSFADLIEDPDEQQDERCRVRIAQGSRKSYLRGSCYLSFAELGPRLTYHSGEGGVGNALLRIGVHRF